MARKIEVQIVGDSSSLQKALGQATSHTSKFGSVLSGALKVGAAAAVTGLGAVAVATKIGIDEWSESTKVAAQTAAVLKSTGGAANVTAGQVDKLATSILNKTGIDDEAIKSGENLLLTFRNIRNETGKGNDIFTRATHTVTDLSVAMGEDMKSASIQVGKALNDPIKGLTALGRIGVTFTEGQKKQIKALVDSGHQMQAQKIILGELNKEFGGSAEAAGKTLPGQLNILKETFRNTAGQIAGSFMPLFVQLAKTVMPLLGRAFVAVGKFVSQFAQGLAGSGKSSVAQAGWHVRQIFEGQVVPAFKKVWAFIQQNVIPIVKQLAAIFRSAMQQIAKVVQQHGAEINRIAQRMGALLKAIGTVAIPILRFALVTVLPKAIGIAITFLDNITGAIQSVIRFAKRVAGAFRTGFGAIKSILAPVVGFIQSLIDKVKWLIDNIPGLGGGGSGVGPGGGGTGGAQSGRGNPYANPHGGRAVGGPVFAGRGYIVGEHHRELFVPNTNGRIIPNIAGGGPVNVNVMLGPATMRDFARVEVEAYGRRTERNLKAGKGWAPA